MVWLAFFGPCTPWVYKLKNVEYGVGGGGGMLLHKQRENLRGKNAAVYSLIVSLRGIFGLSV